MTYRHVISDDDNRHLPPSVRQSEHFIKEVTVFFHVEVFHLTLSGIVLTGPHRVGSPVLSVNTNLIHHGTLLLN